MSKQEKLTPNAMMFQFARMLQEIKDASKAGREYAAEVEEGIKATAVAASLGPSEEMIEKVKHVIKNLDMLGTTLLKTRGDLLEPLADMTTLPPAETTMPEPEATVVMALFNEFIKVDELLRNAFKSAAKAFQRLGVAMRDDLKLNKMQIMIVWIYTQDEVEMAKDYLTMIVNRLNRMSMVRLDEDEKGMLMKPVAKEAERKVASAKEGDGTMTATPTRSVAGGRVECRRYIRAKKGKEEGGKGGVEEVVKGGQMSGTKTSGHHEASTSKETVINFMKPVAEKVKSGNKMGNVDELVEREVIEQLEAEVKKVPKKDQ